MKRFTFPCPGNGVEIEGTFNPKEQSLTFHVSNESLEGRDNATQNQAIEFCKLKCRRGITWDEAQQFLKEQGVNL